MPFPYKEHILGIIHPEWSSFNSLCKSVRRLYQEMYRGEDSSFKNFCCPYWKLWYPLEFLICFHWEGLFRISFRRNFSGNSRKEWGKISHHWKKTATCRTHQAYCLETSVALYTIINSTESQLKIGQKSILFSFQKLDTHPYPPS